MRKLGLKSAFNIMVALQTHFPGERVAGILCYLPTKVVTIYVCLIEGKY